MYKINKNIAIKQKFTKFLYLETIIWLLVSVVVLSITSLFLKNLFFLEKHLFKKSGRLSRKYSLPDFFVKFPFSFSSKRFHKI